MRVVRECEHFFQKISSPMRTLLRKAAERRWRYAACIGAHRAGSQDRKDRCGREDEKAPCKSRASRGRDGDRTLFGGRQHRLPRQRGEARARQERRGAHLCSVTQICNYFLEVKCDGKSFI